MNPINNNITPPLPQTEALYSDTMQRIRSNTLSLSTNRVAEQIQSLPPEELKKFVDRVVENLVREKEALEFLENFSKILSTAGLEAATKTQFPELKSAIQTAKELKESADYYFKVTNKTTPLSPARIQINKFFDFVISGFEGFLEMFGLTTLFDKANSSKDQTKKMILLFGLISSISAILIPILGPAHGLLIMFGVAAFLLLTGQIYPSIRPMPRSLPYMDNWTQKYLEGSCHPPKYSPYDGNFIAAALTESEHTGKMPLLVGPSGTGKTTLIKSFIQEIEQGKHPHLRGKIVHYVNIGRLKPENLDEISAAMGRHRQNIVLVFDNMHLAFQKDGALAEKLEEMLSDPSQFPFVIGITSNEEYKSKIKNRSSFQRMSKILTIDGPNPKQTQAVLHHMCLDHPEMIVNSSSVERIPEAAERENATTFEASLEILSKCVHRTSELQRTPLETRIDAVRARILNQSANRILDAGAPILSDDKSIEKDKLKEELSSLEIALQNEAEERKRFFELRKMRLKVKEKTFQLAQQITEKSTPKEQNLFLLLRHYFAFAFDEMLRTEAARLKLKTELNDDLVEDVAKEARVKDVPSS